MSTSTPSTASSLGFDTALRNFLKPIGGLLADEAITDISINQPGEVWTLSHEGKRVHRIPELSLFHCKQLANTIATFNGKAIDPTRPILSGALPDGERVEVVIPPRCAPGTVVLSIRKPSVTDKTLSDLDRQGSFATAEFVSLSKYERSTIDELPLRPFERNLLRMALDTDWHLFLETAVQHRANIIISGKTGSGKTTATKALIGCIPADERLVTIEDVPELPMRDRKDKVHFFYTRSETGDKDASAKSVLTSCMRHNPDRILLAELRGDETWEYVQSINSGHPGSISTVHANDALMTFDRLTTLIMNSPVGALLGEKYVTRSLFKTIDLVLYYHKRKLREVYYDPLFKRDLISAAAREVKV